MKKAIIAIIFLFLSIGAVAHNPFWVIKDKRLIKDVVELDKNNPKRIEEYFKIQKCDLTKKNLGFNWKVWSPSIGSGYISISATFIYHNDLIVSYSITPELPEEKGLIKKYRKWYNNFFEFESNRILPYHYNKNKINKPLKEYDRLLTRLEISPKIEEYMTPYSGIEYGYYKGGYSNNILFENRRNFLNIEEHLTNEQVILIMYSINPASRLTAIEYYLKNKSKFSVSNEIENWIKKNFKETPIIETRIGCTYSEFLSTKDLVEMYAKNEK